jgi:hypothetical protein
LVPTRSLTTTANDNTAVGFNALAFNTTGEDNTATGIQALYGNTAGINNCANGSHALSRNSSGTRNTGTGFHALDFNTDGNRNTATGDIALFNNTTGSNNTAMGDSALFNNTTGSNNIALGFQAGSGVTTADNVVTIGAAGEDITGTCYIGNIYGQHSPDGLPVLVNPGGKLGTDTSSQRFKEQIRPMDRASDVLYGLKPVAFCYKKEIDPAGRRQLGLVAEDVEKLNPDLIVRDKDGKPYSVRYDQVNAMLLNEFLKEHRKVEQQQAAIERLESNAAKQEAMISELNKNMEALTTQLKEQATQIQKVSAQIEMSRPAPRVVTNR